METDAIKQMAEIVEAFALVIVIQRDQFSITVNDDGSTLFVRMLANTGDVRRLVGHQARHLVALREVARQVCRGSGVGRNVVFERLDHTGSPEIDRIEFRELGPDEFREASKWIASLAARATRAAFPGSRVSVEFGRRTDGASMRVEVHSDSGVAGWRLDALSRAFEVLFKVIGRKAGRIIHASVTGDRRADDAATNAARGETRLVHLSGAIAGPRGASAPGERLGQLGEREMRVRGLRDSQEHRVAEEWSPGGAV